MKYRISERMKSIINNLHIEAVALNSLKQYENTLSTANIKVYKDGFLTIETINDLRKAVQECLTSPMNVSVGLWQNHLSEVFNLLKSCDKAILDDGDDDIKAVYDWED